MTEPTRLDPLELLLKRQQGMVSRRQLRVLGLDRFHLRNQVLARRWVERTPRVVSTFTGEMTVEQRRWMAVLHAGERAMLGGLTAAEHLGMKRWERDQITVLVDDELAFEPVEGVAFFRSRRSFELLADGGSEVPCCRIEPAVLMWAGYDASERAAHAILASAVQQRLTTTTRLHEWVNKLRPLRRAPAFRNTLQDIAGGSHSSLELDVLRLCTRHGLKRPDRQVSRKDRSGKQRWTDTEWEIPDGRTVVLEIDGAFHMEAEHWAEDIKRARQIAGPHRIVIRCTAYELRHEPDSLIKDLIALGVPRVPRSAA